jgi:hypothetical protein
VESGIEPPEIIDRGNVYFFYRPRVQKKNVYRFEDVQRLVLVLSSDRSKLYRSLIVGHKRLPDPGAAGQEKFWGYVQRVSSNPDRIRPVLSAETYDTKTRGKRHQAAARPAGEGLYAFVKHGRHTHLIYVLRFPKRPGEVQSALNINAEASYIVAIKDPESPWWSEQVRFLPLKEPAELMEGAEFVLISASADVSKELGIELETTEEAFDTARIFDDLHLHEADYPIDPLISGTWA